MLSKTLVVICNMSVLIISLYTPAIRLAVEIPPGTEKNSRPCECTYSLHE